MNTRLRAAGPPTDGPSWNDVSVFLRGLHLEHGVTVSFSVALGPGAYVGAIEVTADAVAPHFTGPGRTWRYLVTEAFPGHRHKTLEQVFIYLLHRVDHQAGMELWRQSSLWDAPVPLGREP